MSETQAGALPRLTILTPCRNAAAYVAEAVESVGRQNYPDLEHIVLDAVSTDGTLAILARYPSTRVVSEPDAGSHDAMNKGVRLASGEIVGFLNTDDFYADGVLLEAGRAFAADPELDALTFGTVVFQGDPDATAIVVARDHARDDGFWLAELAFGAPGFNGRFYRRRVFERVGLFDSRIDFSADRKFLISIALSSARTATIPRFGYWFRSHPGSRTLDAIARNAETFAHEHAAEALAFARAVESRMPRRVFLAWHAFESAKLVYFDLRAGRPGAALARLGGLSCQNPLWPFRLIEAYALRGAVRQAEARSTARARSAGR